MEATALLHSTPLALAPHRYYADMVGREGLIGIVLAQSPEYVAPHGSRKAVFGTNPIAISVPAENGAVTMDMATAAFPWFGVLEAKAAGRPVPDGVAIDAQGNPTTDPNAASKVSVVGDGQLHA